MRTKPFPCRIFQKRRAPSLAVRATGSLTPAGHVKQNSSMKTQEFSSPSQPITPHHFRSYNAKRTQTELAVVSPQRPGWPRGDAPWYRGLSNRDFIRENRFARRRFGKPPGVITRQAFG